MSNSKYSDAVKVKPIEGLSRRSAWVMQQVTKNGTKVQEAYSSGGCSFSDKFRTYNCDGFIRTYYVVTYPNGEKCLYIDYGND